MKTRLSRRAALVTGASGVIGKTIARKLAAETGFAVVMVGRTPEKIEAAAGEVRRMTGNDLVRAAVADLSRPESIRALADGWEGPLHVLVNNASAVPLRRVENSEGREMQFAVNVLGYMRMIRAFAGRLADGAAESGMWSRIVNVASYWAGDLDVNDLEFRRRPYSAGTAYRQSKQAERMLTAVLAAELSGRRITVNACHPGEVNTPLSNALGFGGHESPDEGADTPAWLAVDPGLEGITGGWFKYREKWACRFAAVMQACGELYARLPE